MNHNDFATNSADSARTRVEKLKQWEFHMIFECKGKHGMSYTLYEAPKMKGPKIVPGASWIFLTIDDGAKSDIMRIENNQMVINLLDAFDLDPSVNVIARIMDAEPKIEAWIYDFSPAMKADADGWRLKESEKTQITATLNAANQAAAVKKSKSL